MLRIRGLILSLAGSLVLAVPVAAQSLMDYTLTPRVGGTFALADLPESFRIDGPDNVVHNHEFDPAMLYGAAIGLRFMEGFSVEGSFAWAPMNLSPRTGNGRAIDVNVFTYALSGLVFARSGRVEPFLAIGIGGKSYDWDVSGANNEHDIALQFGGGLEYALGETVALRLDARDHMSQFSSELENDDKVIQHDLLLQVGLTISRRAGGVRVAGR